MQNILQQQNVDVGKLETLSTTNNILQAAQLMEEAAINKDAHKTNLELRKLDDILIAGLITQKGTGLNSNVIKILNLLSSGKIGGSQQNAPSIGPQLPTKPVDSVTQIATRREIFRGPGDRSAELRDSVIGSMKKFFTVSGFLDKTGIVKKDSGGLMSDLLKRRDAKNEYINARIDTKDPTYAKNPRAQKKLFAKQFDEQQKIQKEMRQNEAKIDRLELLGFNEKQIARGGFLKKREELEEKLSKVDTRVRPVLEATKAAAKATKGGKVSPAAVGNNTAQEASAEMLRANIDQLDVLNKIEKNTRTSKAVPQPTVKGGDIVSSIGEMVSSLVTAVRSIFEGIIAAIGAKFSKKALLGVITKFFAPAAIIATIFVGVKEGFEEWKKSGSIGKALLAGLQGIVEFISFGLIDKKTFNKVVESISSMATKYIIEPVTKFIEFIKESFEKYISDPITQGFDYISTALSGLVDTYIIGPVTKFIEFIKESFEKYISDPIKQGFDSIKKLFDDVVASIIGVLNSIEIPKISFGKIGDTELSIGPYKPFNIKAPEKVDVGKVDIPKPNTGDAISTMNKDIANIKEGAPESTKAGNNTIISAPSVTNTTINKNSIRLPVRNPDDSTRRYISSRFAH